MQKTENRNKHRDEYIAAYLVSKGLENGRNEGNDKGLGGLAHGVHELNDALETRLAFGSLAVLHALAKLFGFSNTVLAFSRG